MCFSCLPCKFSLLISYAKIFKRLLLPQFSFSFNQALWKVIIRREYRLLLFGSLPQIKKNYGALNFFLTQDYMGVEISKCYSSYSFDPISVKLYEDIAYHGRIAAITFLVNRQLFRKKCGTLKFWHFSCLILLGSVWGHSVGFANFLCYNLQEATPPKVFIQFQPKFLQSGENTGF